MNDDAENGADRGAVFRQARALLVHPARLTSFSMKRLLYALPLIFALTGCMAVLGYEPTPAELEAIRRGEDPRANEGDSRETTGNAGQPANEAGEPEEPAYSPEQTPGPEQATILRWLDSATVVVEADGAREVVALFGESVRESAFDEQVALDDRMNKWTYGSYVRLSYPVKNDEGDTIYRDAEGRLLAVIE